MSGCTANTQEFSIKGYSTTQQVLLYASIGMSGIAILLGIAIDIPGVPAGGKLLTVITLLLSAALCFVQYFKLESGSRSLVRICDWGFTYHQGKEAITEKWMHCSDFGLLTIKHPVFGNQEYIAFNSSVRKHPKARAMQKKTGYNSYIPLQYEDSTQAALDNMKTLRLRSAAASRSRSVTNAPMFANSRSVARAAG